MYNFLYSFVHLCKTYDNLKEWRNLFNMKIKNKIKDNFKKLMQMKTIHKIKKKKIKKDLNESKNELNIDLNESIDLEVLETNEEICDTNTGSNSKERMVLNSGGIKRNRFRDKCFANRLQKGMILLSPKVEKKIYQLKKALRNKGLQELEIKSIIRKRRREEENKFNRISNTKCFKCRQNGHKLADCPLNSNDCEEGVEVCYRCGSSEHKLSECNQKSNGLPFVKCFLCSQIGHLTRDCSQNKRGVYPKGGSCKACHSVNHLIKDCPQNTSKDNDFDEITVPTIETNHSVDADVFDNSYISNKTKKSKIIKF